jgi:hypothetical protein
MEHLQQNINLPLEARTEAFNGGGLVPTPFTGGTSTTVLLFASAATITGPQGNVAIPTWITATNDAALGTIVTIFKPGFYVVDFEVQVTATAMAGFDVTLGVSQDVAAGGLTAVPAFATAGMLAVARQVSIATETQIPIKLSVPVSVSPEQSIAGTLIRFHGALTGGGPPVDALIAGAGGAWFRVRRVNQLHQ